jgi:hypothetical protein
MLTRMIVLTELETGVFLDLSLPKRPPKGGNVTASEEEMASEELDWAFVGYRGANTKFVHHIISIVLVCPCLGNQYVRFLRPNQEPETLQDFRHLHDSLDGTTLGTDSLINPGIITSCEKIKYVPQEQIWNSLARESRKLPIRVREAREFWALKLE